MRYQDARNTIQSGALLAWRGTGLVGRLIAHWTGSDWTHVGVAWRLPRTLVRARGARRVVACPLRAASNALPFDHIETRLTWSGAAETIALARLGKPYSYADFVRAGLGLELNQVGDICSRISAALVIGADDPSRDDYPPVPTPGNLVRHFLDHGAPLTPIQA